MEADAPKRATQISMGLSYLLAGIALALAVGYFISFRLRIGFVYPLTYNPSAAIVFLISLLIFALSVVSGYFRLLKRTVTLIVLVTAFLMCSHSGFITWWEWSIRETLIQETHFQNRIYRLTSFQTDDGTFYELLVCDGLGMICDGVLTAPTMSTQSRNIQGKPQLNADTEAGTVSVVDDNGIAFTYIPE
jgi:hypothetical protein